LAIGPGKSKKFDRWRGPFLITKRLSEWNYQIQLKPGKTFLVNIVHIQRKEHLFPNQNVRKQEAILKIMSAIHEIIKSQPLPLSGGRTQENPDAEDEDATVDETNQVDDTVPDPTWRPGHVISNEQTPENNQCVSRYGPR
jgi:hypothetical protein